MFAAIYCEVHYLRLHLRAQTSLRSFSLDLDSKKLHQPEAIYPHGPQNSLLISMCGWHRTRRHQCVSRASSDTLVPSKPAHFALNFYSLQLTFPCRHPAAVGIAWGTVVGGFDGYVLSGRQFGFVMAKNAVRAVAASTTSFASFLGCYAGVTCLAERLRNKDDWVR